MARIKVVRAAFAGLTLFGHRPSAAFGWALAAATCGAIQAPLKAWTQASTASPSLSILGNTVALVLGVTLAAVIGGATVRAVLLPDPAQARLRLGRSEVWLFVLMLQIVPALLVFGLVFVGLEALLTRWIGAGSASLTSGLLAVAVTLAAAGGLHVRLCLAGPMSVAQGRPRLFASWGMTRGQFWPILAALVLAALVALLVTGFGGLILDVAKQALTAHQYARSSANAALVVSLTPGGLAVGALRGLCSLLFIVIQAAPAAMIYRDLVNDPTADQVAVFD